MPRAVLVTGANGYIGNAVARAFSRAGWLTYGLIRSESASITLETDEIIPVIGQIDDFSSHNSILAQLPPSIDTIVSTTENLEDYTTHHQNTVHLLRTISLASQKNNNGTKPLVIISSGCKDYGVGPHYHGDDGLAPHTEESPLNPPPILASRTRMSLDTLKHTDAFLPVLVRPTNVFGRSASYYRGFFDIADKAVQDNEALTIPAHVPGSSICHALHVDDCGDAYVSLASHTKREEVAGEIFNISSHSYETVDQIANALVSEYGITKGVKYITSDEAKESEWKSPWMPALIDFPQWTGSDRIRAVTGWKDVRPLFSEAVRVYRLSYEAAAAQGHENVKKMLERERLFRGEGL
ncbi:NAD-dependent epimerase/dehydratase family protein [Aspergillus stella-maris]|uniref:NAD-dependent epimerase/dehydratase family protein n=1 Tax=Aspergillus stella-maris TaxID=1810926 RepID=UPI003CCD699D